MILILPNPVSLPRPVGRLAVLLVPLILLSCEELLPPRNDPKVVLAPSIAISSGVVTIRNQTYASGGSVVLRAVNVYDEVIQDQQRIRGTVTMSLGTHVQTILFTSSDLQTPTMLTGNTLTMRPLDTLVLMHIWDHIADDDTPLWSLVRWNQLLDSKGAPYYQTDTTWFTITGSFQIFNRAQPMKLSPIRVPIVYTMIERPPWYEPF